MYALSMGPLLGMTLKWSLDASWGAAHDASRTDQLFEHSVTREADTMGRSLLVITRDAKPPSSLPSTPPARALHATLELEDSGTSECAGAWADGRDYSIDSARTVDVTDAVNSVLLTFSVAMAAVHNHAPMRLCDLAPSLLHRARPTSHADTAVYKLKVLVGSVDTATGELKELSFPADAVPAW